MMELMIMQVSNTTTKHLKQNKMGYQTSYNQCKKCDGITIKTIAFHRKITHTTCKCKPKQDDRDTISSSI
jgi:hypothetical protein